MKGRKPRQRWLVFLVKLEFGVLVFVQEGKPENPDKNPWSKARTSNKLNPNMAPCRNRTRATLVGDERSHHCAIPAPLFSVGLH